jgi:uncharacterized SAM-binding protein YcdF (DUF218 family)
MLLFIKDVIESCILPPGLYVILLLLVFALLKKHKILAGIMLFLIVLSLYAISTPWGAKKLITPLESYKALNLTTIKNDFTDVGAIVVLSGGRCYNTPEYGSDVVNSTTLIRLRYAAKLANQFSLPILLSSNGSHYNTGISEAALMKEVIMGDFAVQREYLLEEKSHSTRENAKFTADILKEKNIAKVFLVTNAWHMSRAIMAFESVGLKVIPAPTDFYVLPTQLPVWMVWIPQFSAFMYSYIAMHEYIGMLWYYLLDLW